MDLVKGLRGAAYGVMALAAVVIGTIGISGVGARADVPDETYKALGLDKNASPKELYDALVKRYNDPAEGAGKGSFAEEPFVLRLVAASLLSLREGSQP